MRVSGLPSELAKVLQTADGVGASVVGRAGLGISWLALHREDDEELIQRIEELRRVLAPFKCVVLDAPEQTREKVDVWGKEESAALELMRRVKARFDPTGICKPGTFVGAI